jgi:DNA-directed RNA polymerase specialized sigma24 family protein
LKLVEGEYGYLFLEERLLGLSYEEISTKYGVPIVTVKGNLHRIVKLLESRIQFSPEFSKR